MSDSTTGPLSTGIVHIGVGRFHRAHEAVYVNELVAAGHRNWAICGVCILPFDEPIFNKLSQQRGVYHVIERKSEEVFVRKVESISEVLFGYKDPEAVFAKLTSADTRIVTFTVTEAGYFYNSASQLLDLENEHIRHDLSNASAPHTLYGYLAHGLRLRKERGIPPFTVQCCDNIQGNGDLVRRLLLQFCAVACPDISSWVEQEVMFPNSMVDRITPAATAAENRYVSDVLKVTDAVPVTCEDYRMWVIEDKYSYGRPPWETVGVTVVESVKPYEKIKVRLLNGGHCALGYSGFLAGLSRIDEAASDAVFQKYLYHYFAETSATLQPVPGIDLGDYQRKLVERFTNVAIEDQILRICKDGSAKIPGFVLPTLKELLSENKPSLSVSMIIACWMRFLQVVCDSTCTTKLDDPEADRLTQLSARAGSSAKLFLQDHRLFDDIASVYPAVVDEVQQLYDQICSEGVLRTFESVCR